MNDPTIEPTAPRYIETLEYEELVAALLNLNNTHDPRTAAIEFLGDIANVWPRDILADVRAADLEVAQAELPPGFAIGLAGDVLRVSGLGRVRTIEVGDRPVDEVVDGVVSGIRLLHRFNVQG